MPLADTNVGNVTQLQRLRRAIRWSRKRLNIFRENRFKMIKEYVGKHYSEDGSDNKVPINMLNQAVSIYMRNLVANAPRVKTSTETLMLKDRVRSLERTINNIIKEVRLKATLRACAMDALFSIGVAKVGLAESEQGNNEWRELSPGEPFCDRVSLDDFVVDMTGNDWRCLGFIGHYHRVPLDAARNNPLYDKTTREKLQPCENNWGEEGRTDKAKEISQGDNHSDDADFLQYTELLDVYLPYQNLYVVIPATQDLDRPLVEESWLGPMRSTGPYHVLSYMDVPDNLMPSAPAQHWLDLHVISNTIYLKSAKQAERQKDLTAFAPVAAADAQREIEAGDGETIMTENPNGVKTVKRGGPDQVNLGFMQISKDLFSRQANNLEVLGGLGSDAETFGQEKLLAESSNKVLAEMQDRVTDFTQDIVVDLGYYVWTDPVKTHRIVDEVPGLTGTVETYLTPEDRDADYYEFNVQIDPYSMRHESPASKWAGVQEYLGLMGPYLPMMMQNGVVPDFEKITKLYANLRNLPELNDVMTYASGTPPENTGQAPGMPAKTERTYNRVNKGGSTTKGKDKAIIAGLLGQNVQDAEKNLGAA